MNYNNGNCINQKSFGLRNNIKTFMIREFVHFLDQSITEKEE